MSERRTNTHTTFGAGGAARRVLVTRAPAKLRAPADLTLRDGSQPRAPQPTQLDSPVLTSYNIEDIDRASALPTPQHANLVS